VVPPSHKPGLLQGIQTSRASLSQTQGKAKSAACLGLISWGILSRPVWGIRLLGVCAVFQPPGNTPGEKAPLDQAQHPALGPCSLALVTQSPSSRWESNTLESEI
jgi:hypothetical protein